MTAVWDLTPHEEAALDSRYWDERYADEDPEADDPDEDDERPAAYCDCGTCCNACGHYPGCTSQQTADDD